MDGAALWKTRSTYWDENHHLAKVRVADSNPSSALIKLLVRGNTAPSPAGNACPLSAIPMHGAVVWLPQEGVILQTPWWSTDRYRPAFA